MANSFNNNDNNSNKNINNSNFKIAGIQLLS